MSGKRDDDRSTAGVSSAPIDFDRLNVVAERFATDDRFTGIEVRPEFAPARIVCLYDLGFYPQRVHSARLEVSGSRTETSRCIITKGTRMARLTTGGIVVPRITTYVTTSTRVRTHRPPATTRHIRRNGVTFCRWSSAKSRIDSGPSEPTDRSRQFCSRCRSRL